MLVTQSMFRDAAGAKLSKKGEEDGLQREENQAKVEKKEM